MKAILPLILALATTGLFVSCDKAEHDRKQALEKQADSLETQAKAERKAGEARADAVEANKPVVVDQVNRQAEAERKAAEDAARELERKAAATRDQK